MHPKNHSILVVDDEGSLCASLATLLRTAGYHVTSAGSGMEAFQALKHQQFHGVLLDLNLPDTSGHEVAGLLKEHHPDTIVIIITGEPSVESAIRALRNSAYDFIRKPFDPDQLLRTLERGLSHRETKLQLRASEERFRQLAAATWEGIFTYEEGKIIEVNDQLCSIFGYSENELRGREIFDLLFDPASIRPVSPTVEGQYKLFTATGRRKSGDVFPAEIRIRSLQYPDQSISVAAVRDMSDIYKAVREQQKLQEQLNRSKPLRLLGEVAGMVAHDLNNIMTGMYSCAELLQLGLPADIQCSEEVVFIQQAIRRANSLVQDLLFAIRGAAAQKRPENINKIVSAYFTSVEYHELQKRYPALEIKAELHSDPASVLCSDPHISRLLTNLVNNAAEACNGRGTVTIHTGNGHLQKDDNCPLLQEGPHVTLAVRDNGPGIRIEDQEKIFAPFFSTKELGRSGTGLGLTIVKQIVDDHGGCIELHSDDSGTEFVVYLAEHRSGDAQLSCLTDPAATKGADGLSARRQY